MANCVDLELMRQVQMLHLQDWVDMLDDLSNSKNPKLLRHFREKLEKLGYLLPKRRAVPAKVVLKILSKEIDLVRKRMFDKTLCNNNCKSMYFCTKKKRHRGKHQEGSLVW